MPDAPAAPAAPPVSGGATETPVFDIAGSEAFSSLDAISQDRPEVADPPDSGTPKPGDRPRGEDGKFTKSPPKPEGDKSQAKPAAAKPGDKATPPPELDFDKPPEKAPELRKHYDALKTKLRDIEAKHAELLKKPAAPTEWPEKKTYEERLADRDKRISEYEDHIRHTNYSKSEDFKERFEKPYVSAFMQGRSMAAKMKVIERKDETGAVVTQKSRAGTADDFDAIMKLSDPEAAADLAVQLFGESRAPIILYHREATQALSEACQTAIKDFGEKGKKWEQEQQENQTKFQTRAKEMVEGYAKAAAEKYPQHFKPDENDPKGNELLEKGNRIIDRIRANGAPLADGETQWNNEQIAQAVAAMWNKAGAFDRLFNKFKEQGKELKDIKDKLAEYEKSTPGGGDGGGRPVTPSEPGEDWQADLNSRAKESPVPIV